MSASAPHVDPRIIERLRHAEDIAARLNTQLQQIAGLSHSDLAKFRTRMLNPDIAIPLLQCYDATIEEKSNEVEALRAEIRKLQARADSIGSDRMDMENQLKIANLQITEMLQADRNNQEVSSRNMFALQSEISVLRQQLAEMNEARSSLTAKAEKDAAQIKTLQETLSEQVKKAEESEAGLLSAKKAMQQAKLQDGDIQSQLEAQRIQLVLISK
jgi:chromosome segregation ATPase